MGRSRGVVKPDDYLPAYEEQLEHLRSEDFTLLELGVFGGQSLEMWRDSFPAATIVGVDIGDCDVGLGDRVHFVRGDQRDCDLLADLRRRFAPESGFGVIIDDASHVAEPTAASLQCLFNDHLAAGGLYVVEDWGTGYMDGPQWGGRAMKPGTIGADALGRQGRSLGKGLRYPSHDYGMVGLVKRLFEHMTVSAWQTEYDRGSEGTEPGVVAVKDEIAKASRIGELIEEDALEIAKLTAYPGMVVLEKARAGALTA